MGRNGTNEVAWRGLPGTCSMVFSNIIDVTSQPPHCMFREQMTSPGRYPLHVPICENEVFGGLVTFLYIVGLFLGRF